MKLVTWKWRNKWLCLAFSTFLAIPPRSYFISCTGHSQKQAVIHFKVIMLCTAAEQPQQQQHDISSTSQSECKCHYLPLRSIAIRSTELCCILFCSTQQNRTQQKSDCDCVQDTNWLTYSLRYQPFGHQNSAGTTIFSIWQSQINQNNDSWQQADLFGVSSVWTETMGERGKTRAVKHVTLTRKRGKGKKEKTQNGHKVLHRQSFQEPCEQCFKCVLRMWAFSTLGSTSDRRHTKRAVTHINHASSCSIVYTVAITVPPAAAVIIKPKTQKKDLQLAIWA